MGSVIRKKNSWAIRYELPGSTRENRKQKQIGGFSSEKEAKKALIQVEAKLISGTYFEDKNKNLSDMLDIWFTDHVKLKLAPKTALFYKNYIDVYLKPDLGGIKLSELKAHHIDAYYNRLLKQGRSASTINKCHRTLRACLYQAYKWEYIENKIIDRVTPPAPKKGKPAFWDESTIRDGLDYFDGHSVYFHVYTALHLGMRQGEICGLKEEDIDYKNKKLTVNRVIQKIPKGGVIIKEPKTESSKRDIPLSDNMIQHFRQRSKSIKENMLHLGPKYNHEWDGFFSVDYEGNIIHDQNVCGRFRDMIKRSDLPKVTFHDLRHSCASWLLAKDASMKDIQEILGHANMATTSDIYSHVTLEKKREVLEKLV